MWRGEVLVWTVDGGTLDGGWWDIGGEAVRFFASYVLWCRHLGRG